MRRRPAKLCVKSYAKNCKPHPFAAATAPDVTLADEVGTTSHVGQAAEQDRAQLQVISPGCQLVTQLVCNPNCTQDDLRLHQHV